MADIFVDDNKVGQTPQLVSQLLVGQHQVRLTRQGYDDYNGIINVHEGETASLTATLKETSIQQPNSNTPVFSEDDGQSRRTITVNDVSLFNTKPLRA